MISYFNNLYINPLGHKHTNTCFNLFYELINSLLFGTKGVLKHQDLKYLFPNWTNMSNFHQLEVVDRGSETQLQVGENLNNIT